MTNSIFFVGHVSVDMVENIHGVKTQPGGAALYAAVAARTLVEDVCLVSAIGRDFPFTKILDPFPHKYLKIWKGSSTRFRILYDERWEAIYPEASYGPSSRITSSLIPLDNLGPDNIVHISPLPPSRVEKILRSIKKASPETKISVNTWIGYIKGRRNETILKQLASDADFFIISDSEAKKLTGTDTLSTALRFLKAKMLVVTLGELGAIVNRENSETQVIPALRFPMEKIVDTTGAGDTWCGSFLAAYKLTSDLVQSVTAASVISSIKCTGWGVSKIQNLRFKNTENIAEYVIGLKDGRMQKRISDYS